MTREFGVISVPQAYDGAQGGVAGWRLGCCGRHIVGLDSMMNVQEIVQWCCILR